MTKINHVVLSGGTHGNELNGMFLIKKFQQYTNLIQRPGFSTHILIGNPKAVALGIRYVDQDLNRSFERESLENSTLINYEDLRARTIDQMFGPNGTTPSDVIVDLHSTTANMGLTLIVDSEEPFVLQLAAYLNSIQPLLKVFSAAHAGRSRDSLRSLARFGFCIEVGPIAQGILHAELFQKTEALIHLILDYLKQYNHNQFLLPTRSLIVYRYMAAIDYPRNEFGEIQAMIHPQRQFKDYEPLHPGEPMFLTFDGETINYEGNTIVYPIFINEAAYYEKGIAMYLTQKEQIAV